MWCICASRAEYGLHDVWRLACRYLILKVRREHLIRDTLLQISAVQHQQEDLKKPLKVGNTGDKMNDLVIDSLREEGREGG